MLAKCLFSSVFEDFEERSETREAERTGYIMHWEWTSREVEPRADLTVQSLQNDVQTGEYNQLSAVTKPPGMVLSWEVIFGVVGKAHDAQKGFMGFFEYG